MSYDRELDFAVSTAKVAGTMMLRYFRADDIGTEWKDDDSPLTVADTAINDFVMEEVKKYFPDHGMHGEEGTYKTDRQFVWVCDPIDGTKPYSVGLPISTFSLALCKDGEPQLGVVYDPFQERLFTAVKGGGAYLNGKPIHVSDRGLDGSYVEYELIEGNAMAIGVTHFFSDLDRVKAQRFTLCSLIIGNMLVATGEFCAAFFGFIKPEDIAASKVIVEEAGGHVTSASGENQRYDRKINGALVSNGVVHEELLEIIRPHLQ